MHIDLGSRFLTLETQIDERYEISYSAGKHDKFRESFLEKSGIVRSGSVKCHPILKRKVAIVTDLANANR